MEKIELKEGMIEAMTDEEYFAAPALSNSFLKTFDRSPGHAFSEIEETAAMRMGTFGHAYLLSEYEYNRLVKAPEMFEGLPLANRKNKPWGDFCKANPGVDPKNGIILHHEQEMFKEIKKILLDYNIMDDLKFSPIYDKCKKEIAVFYFDPESQIWLKGKLDLYYPDPETPIIFDPKFTSNSRDLEKKITDKNLKYYRQAAFYTDLIFNLSGVAPEFYFIGIETKPPYGVDFFGLSPELLERGRYENKMSIEKFKVWKERQKEEERVYPSWEGIRTVQKPVWLKN